MRVLVFCLWLVHWLPLPVLGRVGEAVGSVVFRLAARRRHIALTNLGEIQNAGSPLDLRPLTPLRHGFLWRVGKMFRRNYQESAGNGGIPGSSKCFRDTENPHFLGLALPGRLGPVQQEH